MNSSIPHTIFRSDFPSGVHAIGTEWPSEAESQAAADATRAQLDRSTGEIIAMLASGDPWVRDGQRLVVRDALEGINGSYLLDLVEHRYSKDRALTTSFTGSAETEGLAEEFATGTSPADFIAPLPDQILGLALQQRSGTTPERPFSTAPSFTTISPPLSR